MFMSVLSADLRIWLNAQLAGWSKGSTLKTCSSSITSPFP